MFFLHTLQDTGTFLQRFTQLNRLLLLLSGGHDDDGSRVEVDKTFILFKGKAGYLVKIKK